MELDPSYGTLNLKQVTEDNDDEFAKDVRVRKCTRADFSETDGDNTQNASHFYDSSNISEILNVFELTCLD